MKEPGARKEEGPGKVLFVSTPKSWRGGEQQLVYLMEELAAREKPFALVCPVDSVLNKVAAERGYEVVAFAARGLLNLGLARCIKRVSRQQRFSIIHLNDSHAHTAAYLASLCRLKIPAVLHRRVDFPVKKSLFSQLKYNWDGIKAIICVSSEVKRILLPAIKSPQKVRVVHSGIDTRRFESIESKYDLRKRLGIPKNAVIVGNVAALAPHKDYSTFVRTAANVVKDHPNVFFLGIGEGSLKAEIEELITQSGFTKNIILTGFMEDIPGILKQLDVFLITSKTEGLGTSVLDAFAARIPVVATAAGGIPEMVIHEKTGLLAPVGDHKELARLLLLLIRDVNLSHSLVGNAYLMLDRFTKEKMAAAVMEIYSQVESGSVLGAGK